MKKVYSLLLACMAFGLTAQAQTPITIAAARALSLGTTVTVTGIVTNGSELGAPLRYLQDNTAGIAAYSGAASIPPAGLQMSALNPGDSIVITGVLKNYNNLLEIDPVTNLQRIAVNKPLPAPIMFNPGNHSAAFAEQNEGKLVRLNGVSTITTTTGATFATFSGGTTYRINNEPGQDLRISATSSGPDGIVGKPRPSGTVDIIGIMGQFNSNYQIQPRLYNDFILGNAPNFLTTFRATNISTNSLTVNITTQNPGTISLAYGPNPTLGQVITNSTSTTNHSVTLSGLQPATVYYIQATVTNSAGSSMSQIVPVITASNSTGNTKVYFNRPVAHAYALPNNQAIHLNQTIDDTVIAYINRSKYTIDMSMYSFGITAIANALNAAHARGVLVRYVGDSDGSTSAVTVLNAAIPKQMRDDNFIMHNKFLVIDANSTNPNDPILITGSTNLSPGQVNTDANSIVIMQDQSLAKVYTMEFNEMFGSSTMTPAPQGTFGSSKTDNTPHQVMVGGKLVEVYFSPSDNVNTKLIETINSADHDLEFSTMLITRADIANAIRDRVMMGGTLSSCSGGLINDTIAASTPWFILKGALGNRLEKFDGPGIMHHKHIMVDASAPNSDPQIFVGSHNWSNAANNNNDESSLIIHDYEIVNLFYQEWAAHMLAENPNFMVCNYAVTGLAQDQNKSRISVYPNPNQGEFFVQMNVTAPGNYTIRLMDVTGRVVTSKVVSAGVEPVAIQTSSIPAGLYTVQVVGEGISATSRVVIQ